MAVKSRRSPVILREGVHDVNVGKVGSSDEVTTEQSRLERFAVEGNPDPSTVLSSIGLFSGLLYGLNAKSSVG